MEYEYLRCPRCGNEELEHMTWRNTDPGPDDHIHCENCNNDGTFEGFHEQWQEKHRD